MVMKRGFKHVNFLKNGSSSSKMDKSLGPGDVWSKQMYTFGHEHVKVLLGSFSALLPKLGHNSKMAHHREKKKAATQKWLAIEWNVWHFGLWDICPMHMSTFDLKNSRSFCVIWCIFWNLVYNSKTGPPRSALDAIYKWYVWNSQVYSKLVCICMYGIEAIMYKFIFCAQRPDVGDTSWGPRILGLLFII